MRKFAVIFSLLFYTLLAGSACKKYEDGPYLSFKSREERISNTWKVDKVLINDEEITSSTNLEFKNLKWTFSTNGNVTRSIDVNGQPFTVTGQWALQSNDEEIRIVINSQLYSEDSVWVILKLMEDEFWVLFVVNSDTYEAHLAPAK
jgi:hypothetical protein